MSESPVTAALSRSESIQTSVVAVSQYTGRSLRRAGSWFTDTAQKFGALLADLLSPAVFAVYAMAVWSLASELGWVSSFIIPTGPMSNWIVWLGMALLANFAVSILKKHIQSEPFGARRRPLRPTDVGSVDA